MFLMVNSSRTKNGAFQDWACYYASSLYLYVENQNKLIVVANLTGILLLAMHSDSNVLLSLFCLRNAAYIHPSCKRRWELFPGLPKNFIVIVAILVVNSSLVVV